jgi:hypothetical protein
MNRIALFRLAAAAEEIGEYALADRLVRLAQNRVFEQATGDEMDAIRKDLKNMFKKERRVSPEAVRQMLLDKYRLSVSDERLNILLRDEEGRARMRRDPYVDRIGELVLEGGFDIDEIGQWFDGDLSPSEIYDRWKQFVREHPEVRRDLLRRPDIVHAKPTTSPDSDLLRNVQDGNPPEGLTPIEVLNMQMGEASGSPKVRMRNEEELDEACMETYRLSLKPEFQKPDGSPHVGKLARVVGGTERRVERQLTRAYKIMANMDTRIYRRPEDRDAARDLVSEMKGQGFGQQQLLDALNNMRVGDEPEWSDNNLFGLFGYTGPQKQRKVVPVDRWADYRDYLEAEKQKPPLDRVTSRMTRLR